MGENKYKWLDRENLPKTRSVRKRCKLKSCKTVLSIYNNNDYCHAHRAAGIKENVAKMELIAYNKHKAQERYMKKKKKAKKDAEKLLKKNQRDHAGSV